MAGDSVIAVESTNFEIPRLLMVKTYSEYIVNLGGPILCWTHGPRNF